MPPDVTVAVNVTTVCGANGESGVLDGDTASVVEVVSATDCLCQDTRSSPKMACIATVNRGDGKCPHRQ